MARIAITSDVASLIGDFAEKVENRSLLLDKFVFHKSWPVENDEHGRTIKWDDALRWSFMRLADNGATVLKQEARKLRDTAAGRNIEQANRDRKLAEAAIADKLSNITPPVRDIAELRAQHTRRFLALFQTWPSDSRAIMIAKLEGRLAINLSDGLVQNANICLDRVFGLPYIPGSAVKGVCRHAALEELRLASGSERRRIFDLVLRVFGASSNDFSPPKQGRGDVTNPAGALHDYLDIVNDPCDVKGAVTFLPAWPYDAAKIVVDLTNVHTPDYYRTGNVEDLAKEKPRPNPFPVVESGARFAFSVVLNGMDEDSELLRKTTSWLHTALTVHGLGAKTSAGYGWFSVDDHALSQLMADIRGDDEKAEREAQELADSQAKSAAEAKRIESLTPEELAKDQLLELNDQQFSDFVKSLSTKSDIQQKACISLLRENKTKRERWKTWKKNNKKDLTTPILQVLDELGLPPLP